MTKISLNLVKDYEKGICYECQHYEGVILTKERTGNSAWLHKCHADEMPAEGKCHCPKFIGKTK